MTQETIQAADFKKKPYATPEMKVYEVKARSIIATSPTTSTQNEEYGTVDTSSWF